jgi:hypothetical protein
MRNEPRAASRGFIRVTDELIQEALPLWADTEFTAVVKLKKLGRVYR